MAPRPMTFEEIDEVLALDVPAHLASIDDDGYPHVTPIWFHWDGSVIRMTSLPWKPHVSRLRSNSRVCMLVDDERPERADGERPNRQVRLVGDATVSSDGGGRWTREITQRYLTGLGATAVTHHRTRQQRVVIELRRLITVAVANV